MLQHLKQETIAQILDLCENHNKFKVAILINGLPYDELAELQALLW